MISNASKDIYKSWGLDDKIVLWIEDIIYLSHDAVRHYMEDTPLKYPDLIYRLNALQYAYELTDNIESLKEIASLYILHEENPLEFKLQYGFLLEDFRQDIPEKKYFSMEEVMEHLKERMKEWQSKYEKSPKKAYPCYRYRRRKYTTPQYFF